MKLLGRFTLQRKGKPDVVLGNIVCRPGLADFAKYFGGDGTHVASGNWYIGLIDGSGFSSEAMSDTMASHAGWTELTSYSQSARPSVSSGTRTGVGSATVKTTTATFTATAALSIRGIFLTDNSTKGGTSGLLWSTAVYGSNQSVADGEQFQIKYEVEWYAG